MAAYLIHFNDLATDYLLELEFSWLHGCPFRKRRPEWQSKELNTGTLNAKPACAKKLFCFPLRGTGKNETHHSILFNP